MPSADSYKLKLSKLTKSSVGFHITFLLVFMDLTFFWKIEILLDSMFSILSGLIIVTFVVLMIQDLKNYMQCVFYLKNFLIDH